MVIRVRIVVHVLVESGEKKFDPLEIMRYDIAIEESPPKFAALSFSIFSYTQEALWLRNSR